MTQRKSLFEQESQAVSLGPAQSLRPAFGMKTHDKNWAALLAFDQALREKPSFEPSAHLIEALSHPLAAPAQRVASQAIPDPMSLAIVMETQGTARAASELAEENAWRGLATIEAMGFSKGAAQALMESAFLSEIMGKALLSSTAKANSRDSLASLMGLARWPGLAAFGANLRLELALGSIAAKDFQQGVDEAFFMRGSSIDWGGTTANTGACAGLGLWIRNALGNLEGVAGSEGAVSPVLAHRARLLAELAETVAATPASDEARKAEQNLKQAWPALAWIERLALNEELRRPSKAKKKTPRSNSL